MKKCVKKSIGLMLVASMTVSSLTGCGSTAEESKDTTSKNNVEKTDNSKTRRMQFKVSCILLENYLLKCYEGAISAKFQPSFHQWSARCVLTEESAVLRLLAHPR